MAQLGLKKRPIEDGQTQATSEASPLPTAAGSVATPLDLVTAAQIETPFGDAPLAEAFAVVDHQIGVYDAVIIDTGTISTAVDDTSAISEAPPAFRHRYESIIAALEAASRGKDGNDYVLIYQIMVAAGTLKQATGAAVGKVGGEVGEVIEMLHSIL